MSVSVFGLRREARSRSLTHSVRGSEWKVGRDGDYGAQCVAGKRINLSEGDKKRNGFISDAIAPLPQVARRRGGRLHAVPLPTESLFCHRRRTLRPARVLSERREQQWRRRSSYDFTVVRSLVFSSTFSRGEGLAGRLIWRSEHITHVLLGTTRCWGEFCSRLCIQKQKS